MHYRGWCVRTSAVGDALLGCTSSGHAQKQAPAGKSGGDMGRRLPLPSAFLVTRITQSALA